jgi:hypothetical protein
MYHITTTATFHSDIETTLCEKHAKALQSSMAPGWVELIPAAEGYEYECEECFLVEENEYQPDPFKTKGNYIHIDSIGQFAAYRDGWWQGTRNTYRDAARALFPETQSGYKLGYYPIDEDELVGIVLCADCAMYQWLRDPKSEFQVEWEQPVDFEVTCDSCQTVIEESYKEED